MTEQTNELAEPPAANKGIELETLDLHLMGPNVDAHVSARFFFSYQNERGVWAEITAKGPLAIEQHDLVATSPRLSEPLPVMLRGPIPRQTSTGPSLSVELMPLRELVVSAAADGLTEISFALLDFPLMDDQSRTSRPSIPVLSCGPFDVAVTKPNEKHRALSEAFGSTPHTLSDSVTMRMRSGSTFSSGEAENGIQVLHDAFSFVAGRWVGMTAVEGTDEAGQRLWFRWGTTLTSQKSYGSTWYDRNHPEWLPAICNAFHDLRSHENTWEPIRTALYWYHRSNSRRGAGVDSSLILSQCALELLSWFVIVTKSGALSEEGYGQLNSAAEKLRLALTLLGIPREVPSGLTKLSALAKSMRWKDVADAVVQARNYLVHPTQSRSGKRRPQRIFDWYELWVAAQWLLELVILRLLDYSGSYHNRTRLREIDRIERVPWE